MRDCDEEIGDSTTTQFYWKNWSALKDLRKIVPDSFDLNTSAANYARAFQTTFSEYLLQSGQYVDYAFYTRFEEDRKEIELTKLS